MRLSPTSCDCLESSNSESSHPFRARVRGHGDLTARPVAQIRDVNKMLNPQNPTPTLSPRIRVLIVDDSVVMRKILSDALRDDAEIEVVGTASNGIIALQRCLQLSPDVVTLDIEMPEMDGIATLREIKRQFPRIRVLMCSTLTERGAGITLEALSAGADDYLTKNASEARALEAFQSQLAPKIKQFFRDSRSLGPKRASGSGSHTVQRAAYPQDFATKGAVRTDVITSTVRPQSVRPKALAIGVSTGGPNALAEVIPALPKDFPLPVFVVQHMPPMFTRLLAERLQSHSKVKVVEAQDGMVTSPGCVYIAPGDFHMCVVRRGGNVVLQTNQDPMENSCRPAVDVLFRSVGQVYGGATISVILTGMGGQPALVVHPHPVRSGEHSSGPEMLDGALPVSAEAASATMELQRHAVAVFVEAVVGGYRMTIAAAGRSGIEEVYGVLYLDVGCDVCFSVVLTHHFSPLITAIRREP